MWGKIITSAQLLDSLEHATALLRVDSMVNQQFANWKITMFKFGKSTSMLLNLPNEHLKGGWGNKKQHVSEKKKETGPCLYVVCFGMADVLRGAWQLRLEFPRGHCSAKII